MDKKGDINQVFVYLTSIMIILFVAFLVVRFVVGFTSEVDSSKEIRIYQDLQKDFQNVYENYGSELIKNYHASSRVEYLCFAQQYSCIDSLTELSEKQRQSFMIAKNGSANVAQFDINDIINQDELENFNVKDDCICIEAKDRKIGLVIENRRNVVTIYTN